MNNDHDTLSSLFVVMLDGADLVYSAETGTIFPVLSGVHERQTLDQ